MSFSVGIIGLPNVGKSTLFQALTKQKVDISNYPFCTIDPNVGIVQVPDERLKKIAEIVKPEKITPTVIEFVDIAGLVKGAHKGEGLGNQFLARIREVDAILHIIRSFKNKEIEHVEKTVEPKRDIEIIHTELAMKDLETVKKQLEKARKEAKGDQKMLKMVEFLEMLEKYLNEGQLIYPYLQKIKTSEETQDLLGELQLLTSKPIIHILNIKESEDISDLLKSLPEGTLPIDLKLELEYAELTSQEIKELKVESKLEDLIKACYKILNLITFYTIAGGKETRAWTVRIGANAPQAGGIVHTDFEEKFIRAEVINWENLIDSGSWPEARKKGLIRIEGKEYVVKDGDVIEFKI